MDFNFTFLLLQISLLDSAVNHLKANLKSAADLISLPTTVEELQKVKAKQNGIKREIWLRICVIVFFLLFVCTDFHNRVFFFSRVLLQLAAH